MFEWVFVGLILLLLFGPILLDFKQPVDQEAGEPLGHRTNGHEASFGSGGAATHSRRVDAEGADWYAVPVQARLFEERVRTLELSERRRADLSRSLERAAVAGAGRNPRF